MKSALLSFLGTAAVGALCTTAMAQANEMTNEVSQANGMEQTNSIEATNNVQGQLSARDFKFAKAATKGGLMEVTLGQIAIQNAQAPAVHDFGTKMVQDHQAANQQLALILSQKGASVAGGPGWMDQHIIEHLQGLKGADFDRAYIKRMVSDHEKDIKEFQKEANSGDDADLKAFASKTLPTLRDHLRMARDAQATLESSASR